MKKTILLFAVALGMLTSCDPQKEERDFDVTNITTDQLLAGSTFTQYADAECTIPAEDGNYIKFNCPNVSSLTIFYIKPDGSESVLSTGKSGGVLNFVPKRGSATNQTLYFRYVNQNGEEVVASHDFTVQVASDLTPEMKLIASNDGSKVWKWNFNAPDGRAWGNMGSGEGGTYNGADLALNGGTWWGVTSPEEFEGQMNHCSDGLIGDHTAGATMVITEDGDIICYDESGKQIRKGKFNITDYNPNAESGAIGILNTDAGSILWPYEINSGGNKPTWFEIAYLTPSRLVLCYPDQGKWNYDGSGWTEGTFWQFSSTTDIMGCLTDNDEATWTWDDSSGACWGNSGYPDFIANGASAVTGGQWWGVSAADVAEQVKNYDYGFADGGSATMTFTSDGMLTKSSGGKGGYSYDLTTTTPAYAPDNTEKKSLGRFKTTGDGILFPVRINAGVAIDEFDIVYIDDNSFVLAAQGGESWEATFWRFKKVK